MAVALTTQTSDYYWNRDHHVTRNKPMWFGRPLPDGVSAVELMHNPMTGGRDVRWRVRGDPVIHTMEFEATDECLNAVIIAMKLTC